MIASRIRRARPPAWLRSLNVRFALGLTLALLLVGAPFFYSFYTLHRDRSLDSLRQATTDMSRLLVQAIEQSMFEQSPHTLSDAVGQLAGSELVQRILIVDKTGRVMRSTDAQAVGEQVSRESATCRVCHARSPASRTPATIVTDERGVEVLRTMRPVYNRPACYSCHPRADRLNGVLMVDYSTTPMRARVRADVWRMLALAVLMAPLTLLAIAALMNRLVVKRVHGLVEATRRVRGGDLTATAATHGGDELAVLGESFNAMTATLRRSINEIDRQRSHLEHLIDSMEDQVCVVDSELRIVTANRSFVNATGLWKGAIVGQPCAAVGHGRAPCHACPAQAVFASAQVHKTHFVIPDREGHDRQYEVFCSPLQDESGTVAQVIEVRRDVTERTTLEANLHQSERLASLGLLASGISHEINNPLASIAACADGLARQVANGSCETAAGRAAVLTDLTLVSRETMRAKAITERLLILARPSSGLVSLVDANRAILETITLLRFQAENSGVALTTDLQNPLPPIVADEGQVRQLVLNLALNAIQAAAGRPHGLGRVSIKTASTNGTLELVVADNGQGIDPADGKRIFEPFYTRRPRAQGTGLGLFIVQTIVRGLQGSVRVSSWPGEGAAFIVEVPIRDAQGGNPPRG